MFSNEHIIIAIQRFIMFSFICPLLDIIMYDTLDLMSTLHVISIIHVHILFNLISCHNQISYPFITHQPISFRSHDLSHLPYDALPSYDERHI
jgi:hypothetical protein